MPEPGEPTVPHKAPDAEDPHPSSITRKRPARSIQAEAAFRAKVAELGGEVLEPEWRGARIGHLVRCIQGHENTPTPGDVQRSTGICRTCAGNDPKAAEAAFRLRVAQLGGEVLEPIWLGKGRPHRVRCSAGHMATPRPNGVQQGSGICRICARTCPKAAEAAFRASVEAAGGVVLESAWLGKSKGHAIRCALGHVNTPSPTHVQQGKGICKTCANRDTQTAEPTFRRRVAQLGGTVLEPAWLGCDKGHRIRCARGHETTTRPSSVGAGRGICRFCAGRAWDVFYVVVDDIQEVTKFGITSGDPRPRLRWHHHRGFDRIARLAEGLPGDLAPRLERTVIAALRDARELPVRGKEYFPVSSLALILDLVDGWTGTTRGNPLTKTPRQTTGLA